MPRDWTFPRYVDDPGTYLSQAWSVQYEHTLSPYSYFYDHAPAGWIQIALWSMLTNGFDRYDSAIGFGNECMLIAKLASSRCCSGWAAGCGSAGPAPPAPRCCSGSVPLELVYSRWTFLDNLVTPWLLLAFVLALPRRSVSAATGAALAFAMAALTKETALVVLPALVWALAQNLDRRNRAQVIAVAGFSGLLLMAMYPLYALYKGELLERPGQNSLLGTAKWQLVERESSGSLLDPGSPTAHRVGQWLGIDRYLLLAGLVAIPIALLGRRLRPAVLVLVIQWLVLVRGGYVPFMHVVNLMPWSALVVVGAVEIVAGNRRLATFRPLAGRRAGAGWSRARGPLTTGLAAVCLAAVLVGSWTPTLRQMTCRRGRSRRSGRPPSGWPTTSPATGSWSSTTASGPTWSTTTASTRSPSSSTSSTPTRRSASACAASTTWSCPNWYYATPTGVAKYPTVTEARKHAVAVARFGSGDDGVRIYRVSRYWRPG